VIRKKFSQNKPVFN